MSSESLAVPLWPALNRLAPRSLKGGYGERFEACSHDQELSISRQSVDQSRDRFRIGGSRKNQSRPSKFLQRFGGSTGASVDIFMRA